ncbi:alpha/beta hydrolase [Amnibacterium sp. CER49]|uniref:alpha/beta fold hydrolase n=1 Tax=Amnibacterium sp. CER49 TaxID=3039161 RepID=UPI00244D535E|nr:alpha/beta hydrolase [Amnibacterium sp. CER49]MDH2444803.1 alpha/beta hydrolase [Amnibacterium sp. CER49]
MQRFTTSDGVRLAYDDEGSGHPVVLVNGYCAPASAWVLTRDALLAAGYRVIAFDRRAHGESETPMFGQRMARHGRDLAELLDVLGEPSVTLVGASMGGNVIWAYVDQQGTDRLAGVVVVDQTPRMLNTADWPYGFYGFDERNAYVFATGVPATGRGRPAELSAPAIARLVERLGGPPRYRQGSAPETAGLLVDHSLQDWRDVAERAACPVLMVAGRDSQLWPCEHAAAAIAGNPRGRAIVIDDCGHAVNIDRPDRLNEELLRFLAEVAPGGADRGA